MANLRNLKKDIDYLVNEVLSDCYAFVYIHGDKKQSEVLAIMESLVSKRNELVSRANASTGELNRKDVRKHFKEIYNDLMVAADEALDSLSGLAKA